MRLRVGVTDRKNFPFLKEFKRYEIAGIKRNKEKMSCHVYSLSNEF